MPAVSRLEYGGFPVSSFYYKRITCPLLKFLERVLHEYRRSYIGTLGPKYILRLTLSHDITRRIPSYDSIVVSMPAWVVLKSRVSVLLNRQYNNLPHVTPHSDLVHRIYGDTTNDIYPAHGKIRGMLC